MPYAYCRGCKRRLNHGCKSVLCHVCRGDRSNARIRFRDDCPSPLPPAELARRIRLYTARAEAGLPLFQ